MEPLAKQNEHTIVTSNYLGGSWTMHNDKKNTMNRKTRIS